MFSRERATSKTVSFKMKLKEIYVFCQHLANEQHQPRKIEISKRALKANFEIE